jgi:hypothetical protein
MFQDLHYDNYDNIDIKGITNDMIRSNGSTCAELYINDQEILQKLFIVPDTFNIPSDGILGKDFLKNFHCNINYDDMTLTINILGEPHIIEIFEGPDENTLVIPPRCEVVRHFKIKNYDKRDNVFVPTQEISKGVFTANTIVNVQNANIRIVNTTDDIQSINKDKLITHNLNDYHIYNVDKLNEDRTSKVVDILTKSIPGYVKKDFSELCSKYSEIFALETDTMSVNNFYSQNLKVIDDEPVYVKNYRQPHFHKQEIKRQVDLFLKNDLIEPSTSNYNSPVLIVPKKAKGKWRMCIDYRLINKKIKADRFPLPRIDDILDGLGNAKYFSILDLFQGFHQIPLNEEFRDITSFSTENGSFRWKVVPFGINVAPNSFTRMMNIAFSGLTPTQCFLYMDDLIVIGRSEKDHLENLHSVFETCKKFNLKLNPNKCEFFRPEVTYLGHRCTQNGVLPDDSKITTVMNYPKPTDKDSVKRFVAFANYYRKFIQNFASIAFPLNSLTRKKCNFIWTDECENSFIELKKKLISPPILQYPDFSKKFIITVDASKYGTGAILSQIHDNEDLPISYGSKKFTKGESNKPTIEQELIAIHFAIRHFRPYVFGTEFLVRSDHRPLIYLFGLKDPSSKLTRLRLDLEEYNFSVEHIKGKDNVGADALSRMTIEDFKNIKTTSTISVLTRSMTKKLSNNEINTKQGTNIDELKNNEKEILISEELGYFNYNKTAKIKLICNLNDGSPRRIVIYFKNKFIIDISVTKENFSSKTSVKMILLMIERELREMKINKAHIQINDELFKMISINDFKMIGNEFLTTLKITLSNKTKYIENEEDRLVIIKRLHEDPLEGGHCGHKRLYAKIRSHYFWKNMYKTIKTYVQKCHQCQINKSYTKTKEDLKLTPTPQKPFDIVTIDTIGPLPKSDNGNIYAVTMICNLSKYLISVPVPNKDSKTIAKSIFDSFITTYGPMRQILTDKGTEYKNQTLTELCKMLNIELKHSTAYHHETVGTVERNHRTMNEYLRAYLNNLHSDWDEYLKKFTYCYNITPHSSLDLKYTPYELVFGKKPYLFDILQTNDIDPLYNIDNIAKELKYKLQTAHNMANKLLEISKLKNKRHYDKNSNIISLAIGDKVLVTNEESHKLDKKFLGPFEVSKIIDKNVEVIDKDTNKTIIIHKNRVKKYIK